MRPEPNFRPLNREQLLLLPPDMRQWLPEDDLVYFILDAVEALDLSAIENCYRSAKGGQPAYDAAMMVALLLYAYCTGTPSSRKIEQATHHSVAYRVLTCDCHPDHDTIAAFRKRHLKDLAALFLQVLRLCQEAGLVRLGHVALDGTKVRANASRHKAMSYERVKKSEAQLQSEIEELLEKAQESDAREDAVHGKGRRGDELPEELRFRQRRLEKIRAAKRALEEQAKAKAEAERPEWQERHEAWAARNGRGKEPQPPSEEPDPKAQHNFTDPDSRIMKDGASKAFEQSYNCQAAVDEKAQVIVASAVSQQTNDKRQGAPMVEAIKAGSGGRVPRKMSADSGYFSEATVAVVCGEGIDPYIATGRLERGEKAAPRGRIPKGASVKERMARKLRTAKGRATYSRRKAIVEPVFGQIKQARGFRRFSFRGLTNVAHEWDLVCLTHNLLKLFRAGFAPARG